MNAELGQVLKLGLKFTYVYDFGSSTELALKVVDEREGETQGEGRKQSKSWPGMSLLQYPVIFAVRLLLGFIVTGTVTKSGCVMSAERNRKIER